MSVTATLNMVLTVQEVLETNPHSSAAAGLTVTHNQFNSSHAMDVTSGCTYGVVFTSCRSDKRAQTYLCCPVYSKC